MRLGLKCAGKVGFWYVRFSKCGNFYIHVKEYASRHKHNYHLEEMKINTNKETKKTAF